jgi:hypothetical protein
VGEEIYGSEREDLTGDWRKLHNEEVYLFLSSSIVIHHDAA